MCGALTLIIAISALAALLPALSIMSAALRQSSRVAIDLDPRFGDALFPDAVLAESLAEGDAHWSRRTISASASSAAPMVRMQWWMRPGPRRPCAISNPRPSPSSRLVGGHAHVLELDLHVAVRRVVIAVDGQRALDRDAGRVHRHQDHRLLAGACALSVSVLPIRMATLQRGSPAPDDHHLRPLMT